MRLRLANALFLLLTASSIPFSSQLPPPDPRFGIIEAYQAPEAARRLGAAWERVRFHWAEIQPHGPDQWVEDEITDEQIAAEVAAGREIVGLLIGLPDWAADEQRLPQGLYLSPDDPGNLWANFVRTAVTRYRGQIDHWIIWNEPDVWDANHPGHTWNGDERDFAQLLRTAYLVANEANPQVVIHLPGLSHYWDANFGREPYLLRLVDAIEELDPAAAAHNYYFDVVTYHLYFDPIANYELLSRYLAWLRDNGLEQPLWLVETNAPPSLDPAYPVADPLFRITLQEQAAYIPQMLALSLAAGVERVAIYTLLDPREGADPEPFGLLRRDGSRRPGALTLAVATRYLSGAQTATLRERDAWWWVEIEQPDRFTHVLWARGPEEVTPGIPARGSFAQRTTADGQVGWIAAQAGEFAVSLPGAVCSNDPCFIGGMPVYVVEFK